VSVALRCENTNVSPAPSRWPTSSSRPCRSAPASSLSGACTGSSPPHRAAPPETLAVGLEPPGQIGPGITAPGSMHRLEPDRPRQPVQEARVRDEGPIDTMALDEGRRRTAAAPPLQRDHVEPLAG